MVKRLVILVSGLSALIGGLLWIRFGSDVIGGHLYSLPIDGPAIILDEMPRWGGREPEGPPPYRTPSLMIPTDNIREAYQFVQQQGVDLVTEIEDEQWFVNCSLY